MKNTIKISITAILMAVFADGNDVVVQTGALIYKKSPRLESSINQDRVRWKEYDSSTGTWSGQRINAANKIRTNIFDHYDSSCINNSTLSPQSLYYNRYNTISDYRFITNSGCSERPNDRKITVVNNGWVETYNTSETNTYSKRTIGSDYVYSFRLPVKSEIQGVPCEYSWNEGGDVYYNCVANEVVSNVPSYNSTDVKIIQAQGVASDDSASSFPGVSNVSKNQPDKYILLTKRLVIKPRLECPVELYSDVDGSQQMNWQVYKFIDGVYEDVGTLTSNTSWSTDVFNDIGDGTNQDTQLEDSLADVTDEANWAKYRVNNEVPYVERGKLGDKTCQKKICPIYFNPSVQDNDYCQMQVSTVSINADKRIPKSIYVVYPTAEEANNPYVIDATETLTGRVYTVPDLALYFGTGQNTGIKYRLSLKDDIDDLSVSKSQTNLNVRIVEGVSGEQKLIINVPRVNEMNPRMLNNEIVTEPIYITISEEMKDFPTRELGLRLKIDVNILSPDYNTQRQDLYRCQALDK